MADDWKLSLLIIVAVVQYSVHGQFESTTTTGHTYDAPSPHTKLANSGTNMPSESGVMLNVTSSVVAVVVVIFIVAAIFGVQIRRRRLQKRQADSLRLETNYNESSAISYENISSHQNGLSQISNNYTNLNEQDSSSINSLGSTRALSANPSGYSSTVDVHDGGISSVSAPTYNNKSRQRSIHFVDDKRASFSDMKDKWQVKNNQFPKRTESKDSGFHGSRDLSKSSRSLHSNKSLKSLDSAIGDDELDDVLKTQSLRPGIHDGSKTNLQNRGELCVSSLPSEYRQSGSYDTTSNVFTELQALVAPFINNQSKFTENNKGERCIYATMSFAIGLFGHKGGMLHLPDMSTQLIVPPGALREETILYFFVNYDSKDTKKGQASYSPEIDLGPDGTKFDHPVILSFQHSAILDNGYVPRSLRPVIQQGNDISWREFTYEETLCTISKDRVIMSLDHFSRVKLVGEAESIDPDSVSIDENTTVTADDFAESNFDSTDSVRSSVVCSHNGACACPVVQKPKDTDIANSSSSPNRSARPKWLALHEAIVRKKSILAGKLTKFTSRQSNSKGPAKSIWLCCIAEPCDEIIKLRVYFADTENTISRILLRDAGFRATEPKRFNFFAQDGTLKIEFVGQLRRKESPVKELSKEQVLNNPYDHVEFIMSHTSKMYGLVKVHQSKRTSNKIELNPAWGEHERKANLMRQQSVFAIQDIDIINHMIRCRGQEPIAFKSVSLPIPVDLMMELCKILDPDDLYLRKLADIIGIDHGEFRWFKSRGSVTKTMLSFFQAYYHKESPKDLLQKLLGHLEKIEHLQAAGVVKECLNQYYRVNNPSSESLCSINTSSSSVTCLGMGQMKTDRSISIADSGYVPSP